VNNIKQENILILCIIIIIGTLTISGIVLAQTTNSTNNTTITNNTTNITNSTNQTVNDSSDSQSSKQVSTNTKTSNSNSKDSDDSVYDGYVYGDQYESPGYSVYGEDGGIRQYDDQGHLMGSTYDSDQEYLKNAYGW
jgi:hypothetical protein